MSENEDTSGLLQDISEPQFIIEILSARWHEPMNEPDTSTVGPEELVAAFREFGEWRIQNRPYKKAYEVVEKDILPESTFIDLRRERLQSA